MLYPEQGSLSLNDERRSAGARTWVTQALELPAEGFEEHSETFFRERLGALEAMKKEISAKK